MKGIKSIIACLLAIVLCAAFALGGMHVNVQAEEKASSEEPVTVNSSTEEIVAAMSLDEKISQMIIPAFRTWNDTNMTDRTGIWVWEQQERMPREMHLPWDALQVNNLLPQDLMWIMRRMLM